MLVRHTMKANRTIEMLFKSLMLFGILTSSALSAAVSVEPDSALKTSISMESTTALSSIGDVTPPKEFPIDESNAKASIAPPIEFPKDQPPREFPIQDPTLKDTLPPMEFPMEQSQRNDTAAKILLKITHEEDCALDKKNCITEIYVNETSTTTELSPASSDSSTANEQSSNNSTVIASTTETFEDDYNDPPASNESEKNDAENIQDYSNESSEEDNRRLEEQFAHGNKSYGEETIKVFQDPVQQQPKIHSGHIALIFALTLVVFSVIAYAGLVLWRSHLEKRYGMRQRLVTEDVFYSDNQNDVRYFGL